MNPDVRYRAGPTDRTTSPSATARSNSVGTSNHPAGTSASQPLSRLTTRPEPGSNPLYPTTPCVPGVAPVLSVVSAAAVVVGNPLRRRRFSAARNRA